jgi:hypothetical protein
MTKGRAVLPGRVAAEQKPSSAPAPCGMAEQAAEFPSAAEAEFITAFAYGLKAVPFRTMAMVQRVFRYANPDLPTEKTL